MMRASLLAVFCMGLAVASWRAAAQTPLEVIHVRGGVYMVVGPGGNTTVQIGAEGVLLVDPQPAAVSEAIIAEIGRLSGKPVRYIMNTSADADHVGDAYVPAIQEGHHLLRSRAGRGHDSDGPPADGVREAEADPAEHSGPGTGTHHQPGQGAGPLLEPDLLLHRHVVAEQQHVQPGGQGDWGSAQRNRPVTIGDKLWVDKDSRAELQAGDAAFHLGACVDAYTASQN